VDWMCDYNQCCQPCKREQLGSVKLDDTDSAEMYPVYETDGGVGGVTSH